MAIKDGTVAGAPEEYMNKYLRPFIPETSDEKWVKYNQIVN